MSQKTHSQDSPSDPRNEEDYDTWEYGTEPIPHDPTWADKEEITKQSINTYRKAAEEDAFLFGNYDGYESYRGT